MKRKYKWLSGTIIGLVAIIGIGYGAIPVAERALTPYVEEQINNAIAGHMSYESWHVSWGGTVHMHNVNLTDKNREQVATVTDVTISLDWTQLLPYVLGEVAPERLISRVSLTDGEVSVKEVAAGHWNVQDITKPSTSDTPLEFKALIELDGIKANIVPLAKPAIVVTNAKGLLAFVDYPVIEGNVSAQVNGDEVHVNGRINTDTLDDYEVRLASPSVHLTPYAAYVPYDHLDGTLTGTAITIRSQDGKLSYEGVTTLQNGSVDYENYKIRQAGGTISLHKDKVALVNGKVLINDNYVNLSGTADIGDLDHITVNASANTKQFTIENVIDMGVTGKVNADLKITGEITNPHVSGTVDASDLTYDGYHVDHARGQFDYKDQLVTLREAETTMSGGEITGQGTYQVDTQNFDAALDIKNMPLSLANAFSSVALGGTVSGHVSLSGTGSDIKSLAAQVASDYVTVNGVRATAVSAALSKSGEDYLIDYANATLGEGSVTARGKISTTGLDMDVHGQNIDLRMAQPYVSIPVKGLADVNLKAQGSFANINASGTIHLKDTVLKSTTIRQGTVDFGLADQVLTINRGTLVGPMGDYSVSGTVDLGKQSLDVQAAINGARIEELLPLVSEEPITGWINSKNHITGTFNNIDVKGYVHAWDGSAYGKLFSEVNAMYHYTPEHTHIAHLEATSYGATITGEGYINGNDLDINLLADSVNLEPWLKDTSLPITGYAAFSGHVGGNFSNPTFTGEMASSNLNVKGANIYDVVGEVDGSPEAVNVSELSFNDGQGKYRFTGGVGLSNERLFGDLTIEDGSLKTILGAVGNPVPNLDGHIHTEMKLDGTITAPHVSVNGTIENLSAGDNVLGTATIDGELNNRTIKINTFNLPIGDGLIAAAGSANLDGDSQIQLAARELPLGILSPLWNNSLTIDGNLNGIINVSGKTKNPEVEMSATIKNGLYNGVLIDEVTALATMSDQVIHIQQVLGRRGTYSLKAYGDVPLAAFYTSEVLEPTDKRSINLSIDANQADLGVVPLFTPMVTSASGPISGIIKITGTADNAQAKGSINIKDGSMLIKGVKLPLTGIEGQLNFKGQAVDLTSQAVMGKGNAGLSGTVTWDHNKISNYTGALQLNKMNIMSEYFTGPLTAELYVTPVNGMPTLTGNVDLNDVRASIPLDFESSEGGTPIGLNVTVNADKNVRLYNSVLYDMTVRGKAQFTGTTVDPIAEGKFVVTKGSLKYISNRFNITEGVANFVNGSIFPELHVSANANVKSYKVMMNLDGPATQMKLSFSSDPNLTEQQIISLLTFGREVGKESGVTADDANSLLASSLQSLAGGYLESAFQNIGIDMVNITTGSLDQTDTNTRDTAGNFNIQLGKYITPNLMVTVSRGLNNDMTAAGFQYDITRQIGVTGWINSNQKSYLGAQWHKRF